MSSFGLTLTFHHIFYDPRTNTHTEDRPDILFVVGAKLLHKLPLTTLVCQAEAGRELKEEKEIAEFENFHGAGSGPEWQRRVKTANWI